MVADDLKLEKLQNIAMLFDFYGALLTDKQQQALQLFYEENLSLAEIAAQTDTSRQAVHDLIKRSVTLLQFYEEKLGLIAEYQKRTENLLRLQEIALKLESKTDDRQKDQWHTFWSALQKVKEGE